jgi:hypothetical protein
MRSITSISIAPACAADEHLSLPSSFEQRRPLVAGSAPRFDRDRRARGLTSSHFDCFWRRNDQHALLDAGLIGALAQPHL